MTSSTFYHNKEKFTTNLECNESKITRVAARIVLLFIAAMFTVFTRGYEKTIFFVNSKEKILRSGGLGLREEMKCKKTKQNKTNKQTNKKTLPAKNYLYFECTLRK